jgi:hypothetical protein
MRIVAIRSVMTTRIATRKMTAPWIATISDLNLRVDCHKLGSSQWTLSYLRAELGNPQYN